MEGETGERDDEGADVKDLERGYKRIYGNGADEDAEEIERDPDQENGQRKIKNMLDPKLPTAEEVRQHDIAQGDRMAKGCRSTTWITASQEMKKEIR